MPIIDQGGFPEFDRPCIARIQGDKSVAKILEIIMESQQARNKHQHTLVDGTKRRLAPMETWDKQMTAMENTLTKLVKQQEKTRRQLMAIFFTGIVPLLEFITALALRIWVLK